MGLVALLLSKFFGGCAASLIILSGRKPCRRCGCGSCESLWHMQGVLNTQYSFRRGALACQLRAALSALVFDKTLMVSTADMAGFSAGTVQTMMSVDADRVVNMFSWMHELWSLPLQIVVALGLLYTQACSCF